MPIRELYHSWNQFVNRLRPAERVTRKRNFVWLLVGLYQSRSVHLSKIAEKIPGLTCLPSRVRRIQRFLENRAVRVRDWYGPVAERILQRLGSGQVRLILDGSKVGFGHQLLLVAVAYRKRAIPLAWTWVKAVVDIVRLGSREHS